MLFPQFHVDQVRTPAGIVRLAADLPSDVEATTSEKEDRCLLFILNTLGEVTGIGNVPAAMTCLAKARYTAASHGSWPIAAASSNSIRLEGRLLPNNLNQLGTTSALIEQLIAAAVRRASQPFQ